MRKYLPHILIISFVFILAPYVGSATAHVASVEYYEREVGKDPDDAEANFHLGEAYHQLGKYKKAIKYYKLALRIDPDFTIANLDDRRNHKNIHFSFGIAYHQLNDRDSALEQYRILKRLNSDEKANFLFNGINNYSQR